MGFGFIAFTQVGATCSPETRPESATVEAQPAVSPEKTPVKETKKSVADDGPMPTQDDLPGYPLEQVVGPTARQIFVLARDGFSYDGCPGSLAECLHQKPYQRHALRVLTLATRLAADGRRNTELNELLNRYYGSFAAKERSAVDAAASPCRGSQTAAVTLVEFSDFECPHCASARPLLEEAAARSDVRLCFKPFPLKFHEHARPAAEAALFARDHGKFWEMHDTLFEHQQALDGASLVSYANDLGLDGAALQAALKSNGCGSLSRRDINGLG
jgi:hypothetical protein